MSDAAAKKTLLRRQLRERWRVSSQPGPVTGELLPYIIAKMQASSESDAEDSRVAAVAGFIRHGHEVDVEPLLTALRMQGVGIALPRVVGDEITFTSWDSQSLAEGAFGLLEPVDGADISVDHIDVVLVPAMACGTDGVRLGRGGGYYDRALARTPAPAHFICIIDDDAVMPAGSIPHEDHDVRMHAIATPTRVLAV